jgi:GNAT superfamily N-acetyltransferase
MHALMARTFHAGEGDPLEVTQAELREHPGRHLVFVAWQPEDGKVVGYATGTLLALRDEGGKELPGEAFLCGCFLDRDPAVVGKRLGERLYLHRLQAAQEQAQRLGVRFAGYLAECSEKEPFFNAMGAKRLYAQTAPGRMEEVPYFQPPTDWDAQGQPLPQPVEPHRTLEHLMWSPPPGESAPPMLTVERLLGMVRGLFWYNARDNAFRTDGSSDAVARVNATVDGYERELAAFCARAQDGVLYLWSAAQRQQQRAKGVTVVDHVRPGR